MKERQLNFRRSDNEALVIYTPDKKKSVAKKINDLLFLGAHLRELVESDKLEEGFKETCSSLFESYTTELLKELDYDSVLEKEAESRRKQIRSLNTENRQLRQQLGEKATAEDVRECLKSISEKIRDFWHQEGFQYLKVEDFGPYGMRVVFHTSSLHGMWHGGSAELKEHVAKLKGFGFELCGDDKKEDDALVFSSKNLDVFISVLSRHFNSFKISKVESTNRRGAFLIRSIEVYFQDYDELLGMPFDTYSDKEAA